MARLSTFTIRISPYEKILIAKIADHLQRSRSDAIRYLIFNAARNLTGIQLESNTGNEQGNNVQSK